MRPCQSLDPPSPTVTSTVGRNLRVIASKHKLPGSLVSSIIGMLSQQELLFMAIDEFPKSFISFVSQDEL